MSSLHQHVERHDLATGAIAFRRDCPLCRAERLHGQLPSAAPLPPGVRGALAAAVLAAGAVAPAAVAAADGHGMVASAPASPPPPQMADLPAGGGGEAAPADGSHRRVGESGADADQDTGDQRRRANRARQRPAGSGAVAPTGGHESQSGSNSVAGGGGPARDEASDNDERSVAIDPAVTPSPTATAAPAETPASARETPSPDAADASRATTEPTRGHRRRPSARPKPDERQAVSSDRATPAGADVADAGAVRAGARTGERRSRASATGGDRGAHDRPRDEAIRAAHAGQEADGAGGARTSATPREVRTKTARPATYRVRPGDSLWRIAARQLDAHATTTATAREVSRLWDLNHRRIGTGNPDLIFPGQTLRL